MTYGTAPTSGGAGDPVTTDTITTIDGGGGTFGEAQIVIPAFQGSGPGDITVVKATAGMPTTVNGSIFRFSTNNTSTTQLAAGASFTGVIETALDQPSISILMTCDQPVTITVNQYIDLAGTFAAQPIVYSVLAKQGFSASLPLNANYVNVVVKNVGAATTTTFNVNTAYGTLPTADSQGRMPVTIGAALPTGTNTIGTVAIVNSTGNGAAVFDAGLYDAIAATGGDTDQRSLIDILDPTGRDYVAPQAEMLGNAGRVFAQMSDSGAMVGTPIVRNYSAQIGTVVNQVLFADKCDDMAYLAGQYATVGGGCNIQIEALVNGAWQPLIVAINQVGASNTGPTYATAISNTTSGTTYFCAPLCGARYVRARVSVAGNAGWIIGQLTNSVPSIAGVSAKALYSNGGNGVFNAQCDASGNPIAVGPTAEDAAAATNPLLVAGVVRSAMLASTNVAGDVVRHTMTTSGAVVVEKHAVPELTWVYAAATAGISNSTTAVTIKAAVAAQRGNISSIQLMSEALGAATEFVIRDGAAGTVMWRTKIPAGGLPTTTFTFDPPLRQAAVNVLLEIVTLTASVTGAVYFNAQGYMSN